MIPMASIGVMVGSGLGSALFDGSGSNYDLIPGFALGIPAIALDTYRAIRRQRIDPIEVGPVVNGLLAFMWGIPTTYLSVWIGNYWGDTTPEIRAFGAELDRNYLQPTLDQLL